MSDNTNADIEIMDIKSLEFENDGIEIIDPDSEESMQFTSAPQASVPPVDLSNKTSRSSDVRNGNIIRIAVMVISAGVFLFSAGMLIHIFKGYDKADTIYSEVESSVFTPVQPVQKDTQPQVSDNSGNNATVAATQADEAVFRYNHEALLAINRDSLGYLYVPALNISLPIVQGSDNEFYLTHAVTGEYSGNGTLFVDSRVSDGLEARNAIIYGHCMKNGSMFGSLYRFKNSTFLNSGSNDTFYVYTGNVIYTYKIYSVHEVPAISDAYCVDFPDDEMFLTYTTTMAAQSLTQKDVPINAGDKTITMSTCTNDDSTRLVVHAVRVATTVQE